MFLELGTPTDDRDLQQAVGAGITVVHINTELRLAWRRGFDAALSKQPEEIVPYKILPQVVNAMKEVVKERLALFNASDSRTRAAFD